jgi:hypothetical protein
VCLGFLWKLLRHPRKSSESWHQGIVLSLYFLSAGLVAIERERFEEGSFFGRASGYRGSVSSAHINLNPCAPGFFVANVPIQKICYPWASLVDHGIPSKLSYFLSRLNIQNLVYRVTSEEVPTFPCVFPGYLSLPYKI